MRYIIDDSFREQIFIFYFAHMRRVAHSLFAQGLGSSTVAANLLLTKSKAERWQELFTKGELLKADTEQCPLILSLSFTKASPPYHWEEFAYDIKRAAKVFFDMGLRGRAIAIYLGVPPGTVYWWHSLYKKGQFKIIPPKLIGHFKPQGEKFSRINHRKCYSHEIRKTARECFEKGMNAYKVSRYLDVPEGTVYSWLYQYNDGRFYVNEPE